MAAPGAALQCRLAQTRCNFNLGVYVMIMNFTYTHDQVKDEHLGFVPLDKLVYDLRNSNVLRVCVCRGLTGLQTLKKAGPFGRFFRPARTLTTSSTTSSMLRA